MKKIITCMLSIVFLLSCMISVTVLADSQSTLIRYTVNPTVIYIDHDGTRTTQKVELGSTLKEPSHKGKTGYTFMGWKNLSTGDFWEFSDTVNDNLTLVACYSQNSKKADSKVQLGEGDFSIEIKIQNGISGVGISTDKVELMEMLIQSDTITTEEISQLTEGASMDIILVVKDGSSTITDTSKTQMHRAADGYTIAQYLDISLYKQMTQNGKQIKNQQLHELSQVLTVTIRIPDRYINMDTNIQRTFYVLRNHNGTVDILDSTYNEETHILTFQTDQFSDYAIAYKDVKNAANTGADLTNATAKDTSQNPVSHSTSYKKTAAKTGDSTNLSFFITLLVGAAAAIVSIRFKKQQNN